MALARVYVRVAMKTVLTALAWLYSYMCMYIGVCLARSLHIHIYVYIYISVCIYIYIYIYIHMYISVCLALPLSLPGTYKHLTWLSLTCTRTSGPCDSFGVSPHALAGVRLGRARSLRLEVLLVLCMCLARALSLPSTDNAPHRSPRHLCV